MQDIENPLLKSILVPGWVFRALSRHQRSAADLIDYPILRSILSVDDIAEWFYLNNNLRLNHGYLSISDIQSTFVGLSNNEKIELQNSVVPLSGSEATASSVNIRLTLNSDSLKTILNGNDYDFVIVNNIIYVIINEGFLTMTKDEDKLFTFLKDYLNKCYSMTSIADVSKMPVFSHYVNKLAKSVYIL